jgi:hypothetical protein
MSTLRLAKVIVAVGGLLVAVGLSLLVLFGVGLTATDSGNQAAYWLLIPLMAFPVGYGVLVVVAIRGSRAVAVIVTVIAWLVALNLWGWLAEDLSLRSQAVVLALPAAIYALAATYLVMHPRKDPLRGVGYVQAPPGSSFVCGRCGWDLPPDSPLWTCPTCGTPYAEFPPVARGVPTAPSDGPPLTLAP